MPVARQEYLGLCVLWSLFLSPQPVPRCKKSGVACLEAEELVDVLVFKEKSECT